ncbi:substrate-binding periplasmic protein [Bdellovibrio sp. HCB-110]|uniref:substrate-binding periplasmic protein n=1 Tax=Bdellovibrio sp. HCB-110 TaxID=3391182 RepID=UPI0039B45CE5
MVAFLFALLVSISANAYVVIGHDFEPYYFKSGSEGIQGACYEIIQKLCQMEKIHCKFKLAPFRKFLTMLKDGDADIGCPLAESPQRHSVYYFSEKIFATRYAFFGAPEYVNKIKTYDDLKGLGVGVMSPSLTEVSLLKAQEYADRKIKIHPEVNTDVSLRKANTKKYALTYVNRDVANAWIKKNRSRMIEVKSLGEDVGYSLIFSKKSISQQRFEKMQAHLQNLFQSKELASICEKYNLTLIPVVPDQK